MATDAQRINTLRDCLQDVKYDGHQLDLLAKAVAGQTRTHGRPPAKAFAASAPNDAHGAWPRILREVDSTLTDWWTARDAAIEAIEAVDDLSGHLFYKPHDPLLDRWTTKLRSWLVNLPGEWLRGTYTKRYGADAGKFLKAPMPVDWMDNLAAHVGEWDRDLNAVQPVASSKVTACPRPILDTTPDTNNDTPKKKPRTMNTAAASVSRLWRAAFLGGDETIAIRRVADDYVENGGDGKASSIVRTLADNPDQWKTHPDIVATKAT